MGRIGILHLLALLLFMAPSAPGSPFEATVVAEGSASIEGVSEFRICMNAAIVDEPAGDAPSLRIEAAELEVEIWDFPYHEIVTDRSSPLGAGAVRTPLRSELLDSYTGRGTLTITGMNNESRVHLSTSSECLPIAWTTGLVRTAITPAPYEDQIILHRGPYSEYPDMLRAPFGHRISLLQSIQAEDNWQLALTGASVVVEDGHTWATGKFRGATYVQSSGAQTGVVHVIVAVIQANGVAVIFPGETGWMLYSSRLAAKLDGTISLQDAKAEFMVNESTFDSRVHLANMRGTFSARAEFSDGESSWAFAGNASYLEVNGQEVHRDASMVTAVVSGFFVTVLIALWRFLSVGSFVVLRSRTRLRILKEVSTHPGVTAGQLARTLGLTRQTIDHHVRHMVRDELLDHHQQGVHKHYYLNSHTFRTYVGNTRVRDVIASSAQDTRRQIVTLLERGHCDYAAISSHWPSGDPPSRRMMTFHIDRLVAAGVVERVRFGRRVRYRLLINRSVIATRQASELLKIQKLDGIYALVPENGINRQELICKAVHDAKTSKREAVRKINHLLDIGFLENRGERLCHRRVGFIGLAQLHS